MKSNGSKKRKREYDSKKHEKISCLNFLELYNKRTGNNIKFKRFGNPNLGEGEPDCICDEGLNIEVATAYYDNEEAKNDWGFIDLLKKRIDKDSYKKKYPDNTLCMKNPDQGLYNSINTIIINKNKKEYSYDGKLFLLIYSRPAISDEKDIEDYIKKYRNFTNIKFNEIWLLLSNDQYLIFQLAKLGDNFSTQKGNEIKFERIKK